jgi:hypothetical protein
LIFSGGIFAFRYACTAESTLKCEVRPSGETSMI